ncbi:MAG TPA: MFS transporter [Solirubrobacteraceae bacterium]|nr:MFS transporter [Solirubrobacteraceae bacterium]
MPRTRSPLPVLLAAAFVVGLDFFIVNVALPSMQADLDAGSAAVQLWVAGYGAALGALLILGSRLGDLHGRRRVFVLGLAGFTAASAGCGLAPDATTLVLARLAQGATAALLMPQILAIIAAVFTEPGARGKAIAAYGLTAGLAAVSGQLVGGVLIETDVAGLGWRACFLVNVPIGVAAIALAFRTVPESRAPGAAKLDLLSVELVTGGIGALVFGLAMGQERGWPLWTVLLLDAALVLLAAFALRQRKLSRTGREALIDPALWRRPGFTAGAIATLAFQLGLASTFFVLALELQGGLGLTALESGLAFTPLALGYFASSVASPALSARFGTGALVAGALTLGAGFAGTALTAASIDPAGSVLPLLPGLIVTGVGMGLLFAPLMAFTLATVEPAQAGGASGVVSTIQQVGNAVGVTLLAIVFLGALDSGSPADHAGAFADALWCLAGLALVIAVLARLLPRPAAPAGQTPDAPPVAVAA